MLITLTITNHKSAWQEDVQVNPQQKIEDTLSILQEAGRISSQEWTKDSRIRSVRRGILLDAGSSYEQEEIYTGDILELL